MISKELALDFAKELFGSAVKLTPCVYKFEGNIAGNSNTELINNIHGKFILVKISATYTINMNIYFRTPKMSDSINTYQAINEINDCDDLFLPVRYLRISNSNAATVSLGVYAYGYAVE